VPFGTDQCARPENPIKTVAHFLMKKICVYIIFVYSFTCALKESNIWYNTGTCMFVIPCVKKLMA
jgi:hypothetical protein